MRASKKNQTTRSLKEPFAMDLSPRGYAIFAAESDAWKRHCAASSGVTMNGSNSNVIPKRGQEKNLAPTQNIFTG